MPKPRMTKAEKAFTERIHAIVFATPEIRNGVSYLDRKAFYNLPPEDQARWNYLLIHKTRQAR